MSKYKYYLKKPKSEITKDILLWLVVGGIIAIAATSPYFGTNLIRAFQRRKRYNKKKVYDTFSRLRREGYVRVEKHNHQIYISLTEEGRKKAGRFQIDSLHIQKPKRWDGKWRVIAFDVREERKKLRPVLRQMLRGAGFVLLQDSVWIHPYPCDEFVLLLKSHLQGKPRELLHLTVEAFETDSFLRKHFNLIT